MADEAVNAIFTAIDRFTAPLKRMEDRSSKFIKSIEKGLGDVDRLNDRISGGIKSVAAVGAAAGFATAAVVKDIVETGAAFDKVLVAAAAKFDPAIKRGTAGFEQLRATAERIGEDTEFNAQQAAEGLKALASAGFDADQAMAGLPVIVDLATAAEVDLGTASEMATKSLGAFGLKSTDAKVQAANLRTVIDVLAKTSGKTEASMEGLFESIKEGGPITVAAGQSMQTFMAMAGKLAAAGIEGSVAGTTLKNVFTSFSTKKGVTALAHLGVKTKDANGNMRDAVDILADLEAKTKSMGSAKRLATLEGIFGKIPLAGVSSLLDQGTEGLRELRKALEENDVYSKKLAKTMRDTVAGDLDELSSKIDGVKIALFTTNNKAIRDVIQGMTQWVAANKEFIVQGVGDTIKWIADNMANLVTWAKRIAVGVAIFYAWSTAIKTAKMAIDTYRAAVALATAANWGLQRAMAFFGPPMQGPIQQTTKGLALFGEEAGKAQGGLAGLRTALNASKLGSAINGVTGKLGQAGLYGAAFGVGLAFGTWLNNTFALDEKISGWVASLTGLEDQLDKMGGRAEAPGLQPGGDMHLADGSIQRADGTWAVKSAARLAKEAAAAAAAASQVVDAAKTTSVAAAQVAANAAAASTGSPPPKVVSPADRVASSINETKSTESAEVTIRDKTQRAEVTKKPGGDRVRLNMKKSGSF